MWCAPRVAMEFMRHSEMRLTNKTHTDVAHLPMAEAAEKLPQFATEKWTQILTQAISTAGRKLSLPVVDGFGKTKQETPDNTEVFRVCHSLSRKDIH